MQFPSVFPINFYNCIYHCYSNRYIRTPYIKEDNSYKSEKDRQIENKLQFFFI